MARDRCTRYTHTVRSPAPQDALRDKYSKFDDAGNPTHDAEGSELDDKGLKKAKKDVEKERKMRAPLTKVRVWAPSRAQCPILCRRTGKSGASCIRAGDRERRG